MKLPMAMVLGVTFSALLFIEPSRADLLGWLAGSTIADASDRLDAAAQKRIDQLLNGFDETSKSLIEQGAHESNLLLVQGGNQMQLLVASARAQFGSEMDKQVSQASGQLRPFLVALERFELSQEQLKSNLVDIQDLLALDMQDLPFSQSYFGIRRVLGSVIVQNRADSYPIILRGPHFGMAASGETIKFEVKLDGAPLGVPELGSAPGDAVFRVPSDMLKTKFQDRALVTIPMDVTITRDTPRTFLVIPGAHDVIKQSFVISLMPDYAGDMEITTTRPIFIWKAVLPPETQDHTVSGPHTFSYTVANPSLIASPNPGEQKVSDDIRQVCHEDMKPARRFPNGKIVFHSDPIFTNGWDTPKYIGADPVDWDIATQQVYDTWGIRWSTHGNNACGPINSGRHCHVPKVILLGESTDTTLDATGCHQTALAAPQWRNNHTQVSLDVTGGSAATPAPWSLTFQALSYVQDGAQDDDVQKHPVFASKPTQIDILRPSNTSSRVAFVPFVGKPKHGQLGHDIDGGPKYESSSRIGGDIERHEYSFRYPTVAP
jgi:hypothetical protein